MASSNIAITQSGISFAAMNVPCDSGVTLSWSSVPISFSRTMFIAVMRVPITVTSCTRIPGTMKSR